MGLKRNLRLGSVGLLMFCASCGSDHRAPEALDSWWGRSEDAWTSMKDGNQDVPSLDGVFVQNGMSTAHEATFLVFPKLNDGSWKGPGWPEGVRIKVAPEAPPPKCIRLGQVFRCQLTGLNPRTSYTVEVGDETAIRLTTAPEGEQPPTSVVLISCNEPWSRPAEEEDDRQESREKRHPQVAISSANALRLLDLRATGRLPVKIGQETWDRPSFLLGLGDQAYVDAEPDQPGSLALFGGERSDQLLVDVGSPDEWEKVLDRIYRMHFFVPTLHRALQNLPVAMVWDDHEIRDGWGSQGDEEKGKIQRWDPAGEKAVPTGFSWKDYFDQARGKAMEFEFARNPGETVKVERAAFDWGPRVKVFLMETRSDRKSARNLPKPVFSDQQGTKVKEWLAQCGAEPSVFLLGVPVPLTFNHENWRADIKSGGELKDDMQDGWWWPPHSGQREFLLKAIGEHAARCPKDRIVVVSGDVHESGLYGLLDDRGHIAAYEVVSSGISTLIDGAGGQGSTFGTYMDPRIRQIGRLAQGASFAELLMNFPDDAPPEVTALFFSTSGASDCNQSLNETLVNAAPALADKPWTLADRTPTSRLWTSGIRYPDRDKVALLLEYGIPPPATSTNYGLTSRSIRCETEVDVMDTFATNWQSLMPNLPECKVP